MIDIRDQNQITKLTQQITNLENRIKALESALQVSHAGVVLKSTQALTIQSSTVMTLKSALIQLN